MDTTREYIEMCAAAVELQQSKKQHFLGDVVAYDNIVQYVVDSEPNEACVEYETAWFMDEEPILIKRWYVEDQNQTVWLPRQDQIQSLFRQQIAKKFIEYIAMVYMTLKEIGDNPVVSMEQLQLKIYMRMMYNKVWENKTWKVEKK